MSSKIIKIPLRDKCGSVITYAIIDRKCLSKVNKYRWHLTTTGYARTQITGSRVFVYMHRLLLNTCFRVDHINGSRLDNRLANLRECSVSQNAWNRGKVSRNTSGYKGVSWDKKNKRWRVLIMAHGKQIHVGRFDDIQDARKAYLEKAKQVHGKFAHS